MTIDRLPSPRDILFKTLEPRNISGLLDLRTRPRSLYEFKPVAVRAFPVFIHDYFYQVSIFQGGFDKQAAFGVASASLEVLASLVDRSFLRVSAQERFDAHELLIQYGREKLQLAGETEATLQGHFNYFLQQAVDNDRAHHDGQMLNAILWIAKEYSNLQAALTWGEKRFPKKAERLKKAMHVDWHSYGVHLLAGVDT